MPPTAPPASSRRPAPSPWGVSVAPSAKHRARGPRDLGCRLSYSKGGPSTPSGSDPSDDNRTRPPWRGDPRGGDGARRQKPVVFDDNGFLGMAVEPPGRRPAISRRPPC